MMPARARAAHSSELKGRAGGIPTIVSVVVVIREFLRIIRMSRQAGGMKSDTARTMSGKARGLMLSPAR